MQLHCRITIVAAGLKENFPPLTELYVTRREAKEGKRRQSAPCYVTLQQSLGAAAVRLMVMMMAAMRRRRGCPEEEVVRMPKLPLKFITKLLLWAKVWALIKG